MIPHEVPPGVPPAVTLKVASAVLRGMSDRTLARWCRTGFVRGFQSSPTAGSWWVPTVELARIGHDLLLITPDWEAAL
jgi:hypothetical protein